VATPNKINSNNREKTAIARAGTRARVFRRATALLRFYMYQPDILQAHAFPNDPFSRFHIIQMANTNDTSTLAPILPPSTTTISVKLDDSHNYLAWKTQFLNLLRGHELVGFIDGTEACPLKNLAFGSLNSAYVVRKKKDVCLLGWILSSLSEKLVSTIYGMETSKQVWTALQARFSSQSCSRISHLKQQL
jgi:hypothetical protein